MVFLQPVLLQAVLDRGADVHFSTEFISLTQSDDSVLVELLDRTTKSKYV